MRRCRRCPRRHCACQKPVKEIVHPVKHNVVHCCSEETIKHVHPSHTTVKNHHLIKNQHVYPHSTSVQNSYNAVDMYGGPSMGPGSQVAGATSPGMGYGPNGQVAGATSPDMGYGMGHGKGHGMHCPPYHQHHNYHHNHHNHKKWC